MKVCMKVTKLKTTVFIIFVIIYDLLTQPSQRSLSKLLPTDFTTFDIFLKQNQGSIAGYFRPM